MKHATKSNVLTQNVSPNFPSHITVSAPMEIPRAETSLLSLSKISNPGFPKRKNSMRTYPLSSLWHKTVKGTELEHLNWDEIANCLVASSVIALVAAPGEKTFDRYTIIGNIPKPQFKKYILFLLTKEFKQGEVK